MATTTRLGILKVEQAQSGKETVINAALDTIDAAMAALTLANSFTNRNNFTKTPDASANYGVVNIGTLGFAGGGGTAFAGNANGQFLAGNIDLAFTGLYAELQANGLSVWRLFPTGILLQTAYDTANTGISYPYAIRHGISTAATGGSIGIGSGIGLEVESSTDGTFINIGAVACQTTAVGSGSQSSKMLLQVRQAGALVTPFTIDNATITYADPMSLVAGSTTGLKIGTATSQKLGFFNSTPVVKPTATGSRSANAALASLLTALANLGLVVDSTTA